MIIKKKNETKLYSYNMVKINNETLNVLNMNLQVCLDTVVLIPVANL